MLVGGALHELEAEMFADVRVKPGTEKRLPVNGVIVVAADAHGDENSNSGGGGGVGAVTSVAVDGVPDVER